MALQQFKNIFWNSFAMLFDLHLGFVAVPIATMYGHLLACENLKVILLHFLSSLMFDLRVERNRI